MISDEESLNDEDTIVESVIAPEVDQIIKDNLDKFNELK
jgi:hypothetical protein